MRETKMHKQARSKTRRRTVPGGIAASAKSKPADSAAARVLRWGPCALALLIFAPALKFDFIYDDHAQITANPQVQSWAFLPRLLTTHLWSQRGAENVGYYYRPLFSLWLLILHTLGGLCPWFWHLGSVVLHALATYFVFRSCLDLIDSLAAAGFSAFLFAVHPVHIESVSWVSASDEILCTIFVLASLLLFRRGLRIEPGATFTSWLSVVLWGGALFSKETAVAVLPLFFFLAYKSGDKPVASGAPLRRAVRLGAPFLTAALVYLAARSAILHRSGLEAGQQSWQEVLYTSPSVFVFYIGKLLWPVRLSGFYPTPLLSSPTARTWFAAALILGGCAVLAWFAMKRSDATGEGLAMGLAAGLLVLPILPALVGMRLFRPGDLVHDRYLYLPSVGLCLLAGVLAKRLWREAKTTKIVAGVTGLCLLVCFAWLNLTQQGFYKNDELFYRRAIEVDPNNVLAIDYLGNWYFVEKQMGRALEQFALAHKLKPDDSSATFFLATGLFVDNQYSAAEPYLKELADAPRLWPGQRPIVLLCLGKAETRLGHLSHAEEVLVELRREDDAKPGLHEALGNLYQTEGRIPEAQAEYAREFQVSRDPAARQKALDLARLLRSRPASSPPIARVPRD